MALSLGIGSNVCPSCASLNRSTERICGKCGRPIRSTQHSARAYPDKERIYEEERVRLEVQQELKKQQGKRATIFMSSGCLVLFFVIASIFVVASYMSKPETSRPISSDSNRPDFSDPNRLNVSEPTFSTAGIRFTLHDTRPNDSLWVSINVGRDKSDKNLMSWIALYGVKPGPVSISFRDCKYMDSGIDSLASANKCEVTIGAKLKDGNKIVYTTFDGPISQLRRSLADAAR